MALPVCLNVADLCHFLHFSVVFSGQNNALIPECSSWMGLPPTDYSFSGSRPLKAIPEPGLLYERHLPQDSTPVQQCYIRPAKAVVVAAMVEREKKASPSKESQQQQQQQHVDPGQITEAKVLPNGIPVSRLEHAKATAGGQQAASRSSAAKNVRTGWGTTFPSSLTGSYE